MITEITDYSGENPPAFLSPAPALFLALAHVPALLRQTSLPPWLLMWLMAFGIFSACKWLSWKCAPPARRPAGIRGFIYLLWPGMDPAPFLKPKDCSPFETRQIVAKALLAATNCGAGVFLLWLAAHIFSRPLTAGWVGMTGLVLLLHFGLFALLGCGLRSAGVTVEPIMRAPFQSRSLTDFWGARWNTAFSYLARTFILRPLGRRLGASLATLAVFLVSGFVHEVVISLPAGAGFGLPTGYFLLQGFGCLVERSAFGRRVGLGSGLTGRLFMAGLIAGPVFWLFHPAFVRNVFVPMLRVLGAN